MKTPLGREFWAAIRDVEEAATPAPWEQSTLYPSEVVLASDRLFIPCDPTAQEDKPVNAQHDVALVVLLRNNAVALLDAAEANEAEYQQTARDHTHIASALGLPGWDSRAVLHAVMTLRDMLESTVDQNTQLVRERDAAVAEIARLRSLHT